MEEDNAKPPTPPALEERIAARREKIKQILTSVVEEMTRILNEEKAQTIFSISFNKETKAYELDTLKFSVEIE